MHDLLSALDARLRRETFAAFAGDFKRGFILVVVCFHMSSCCVVIEAQQLIDPKPSSKLSTPLKRATDWIAIASAHAVDRGAPDKIVYPVCCVGVHQAKGFEFTMRELPLACAVDRPSIRDPGVT
jgi:hypothetical protein